MEGNKMRVATDFQGRLTVLEKPAQDSGNTVTGGEDGVSLKFQKLLCAEREAATHTIQGERQVWEAEMV